MAEQRLLAVCAGRQRVGYAMFINRDLVYWTVSQRAGDTKAGARSVTADLIARLSPNIALVQDRKRSHIKSRKTQQILGAVAATCEQKGLLTARVPKVRSYKNKYQEAAAMAEIYPELKGLVPKPRQLHHAHEPNTVALFAAVALAARFFESEEPLAYLARQMG